MCLRNLTHVSPEPKARPLWTAVVEVVKQGTIYTAWCLEPEHRKTNPRSWKTFLCPATILPANVSLNLKFDQLGISKPEQY